MSDRNFDFMDEDAAKNEVVRLDERVRELESELAALEAKCAAMEEIIGKLPTTADAVPIVPGMQVWLNDPAGVIECEVFAVPPSSVQVPVIISHADGSPVDVSKTELFSTEAAAALAKGTQP